MKNYNYIKFVFSLLILSSCVNNKTFNNETALLEYIKAPKNGYTQSKTINGVDYTLTYRPTDMLVVQELGNSIADAKHSSLDVAEVRNKYNKYMYFNLSMSKNNQELLSVTPKNRNEFGAMVNQLAFGMNEKVHVYTPSKDTLEMADFIYPRMYGISRATTIMFVYPRDVKALNNKYINFTIEDLGLYTGEVKFKIPIKKIKDEPKLKL
ncbi:hypothetical protein [Flavivirga jejuensis]|uniref:Lipoprotein n=1 Tax=Flavivirga jejuensis TaxID=870487 RepID=A0ABT8WNB1_9FLAO|nr:hypothetical protein [Flavivirga jejuensis]MDO5974515.1 hypothetical protein [Flavivirga jejuensis]